MWGMSQGQSSRLQGVPEVEGKEGTPRELVGGMGDAR